MAPSSPAPSKMGVARRWRQLVWLLNEGGGCFAEVGTGTLDMALAMMMASRGEMVSTIISSALENGGGKTMVPVGLSLSE